MSGRSLLLHLSMPKPTHGPIGFAHGSTPSPIPPGWRHRSGRQEPQRDVGDARSRADARCRLSRPARRRRLIAPCRRAVIQAAGRFQHLLRPAAAFAGGAARLAGRVVQLLHLRRRSDGDGRKFGEHLSILARGGGEALQRQFNAGQPASFPARPPSVPPIR